MSLVVAVIVIYLIYLFFKYLSPYLLSGGGILALIILGVGALVGALAAIKNYGKAIRTKMDFSSWEWTKGDEPARRSYYFGPGYQQLKDTIREAFRLNKATVDGSTAFILYRIGMFLCIYILGSIITIIFSAFHWTVTTIVMLISYLVFSITWLVDRIFLLLRQIRSVCPMCHRRSVVPFFECPQCGEIHKKLVPGPYGVFNHTCSCGYSLPSTFFNGRSRMESLCPHCTSRLVTSDAQQLGIQLIGGSKAGKSVLLSAFFHEFFERLKGSRSLRYEITEEYQPYFDELEEWYQGLEVPPTEQLNSQMYPVLIKGSGTKKQFSVYDIAGEMFDGTSAQSEVMQEQFHYCDGLLFLLDPFSDGELRRERQHNGEPVSDFSNMRPDEVANNFINYLVETGKAKTSDRCAIPMAVLIAKSDMREVKSEIGPAKLNALVKRGVYRTYEEAREAECRDFLNRIGLDMAASTLEAKFSNLRYFPISAMGHSPDGEPFEPWGISEVLDWLMPQIDSGIDHGLK